MPAFAFLPLTFIVMSEHFLNRISVLIERTDKEMPQSFKRLCLWCFYTDLLLFKIVAQVKKCVVMTLALWSSLFTFLHAL